MRHAGADEELAGTGRRDSARAIVGIIARADHGRIADPAPTLAGESAGRGRRRDVVVRVGGDRADRAELHPRIEALTRLDDRQLSLPLLRREPTRIDRLDTSFARERLRAIAA